MYLNENALDIHQLTLKPLTLAKLIALIDEGKVSHTAAAQHIFPELVANPNTEPLAVATAKNLIQESDESALLEIITNVVKQNPAEVEKYKGGKKNIVGMFMGEVMKASKGKADPKVANKLLIKVLDETELN
jgi:aspartyl-tRNA(Asn)/glutamyl-tRNA(Gln) amidotransferase subunit B